MVDSYSMTAFDVVSDEGFPVQLPSGATFYVLTKDEERYLKDRAKRYLEHNHLVNISDLQDFDRLLEMELFHHRWALWLSKNQDYWGQEINDGPLRRSLNDLSGELRQLKKSMGIDKSTRDKEKGEGSVSEYIANLQIRAKEFGIMRNEQFAKAMELWQQATALITLYDNCTVDERIEMGYTQDDIFDWFRNIAIPEYKQIDETFRKTKQKMWIKKL